VRTVHGWKIVSGRSAQSQSWKASLPGDREAVHRNKAILYCFGPLGYTIVAFNMVLFCDSAGWFTRGVEVGLALSPVDSEAS
jgi:hypothetical protein